MTRKSATVLLADMRCAGGTAHTVETALRRVRGVSRAYVNPATEAAYVEYDAEQCGETDFATAVESVGVRVVQPVHSPVASSAAGRRHSMPNTNRSSRRWWAFAGFIVIAGFFLVTEHRAHLFGILPFLFLLACPLLHMFGHGGHGAHGGAGGDQHASGDHQHMAGGTHDNSRSEP